MSNSAFRDEWPAMIARGKGWQVGDTLRAQEEKRDDAFFEITAIGHQIVLGRRVISPVRRGNEIELSLGDEFIKWSRSRKGHTPAACDKCKQVWCICSYED